MVPPPWLPQPVAPQAPLGKHRHGEAFGKIEKMTWFLAMMLVAGLQKAAVAAGSDECYSQRRQHEGK